MPSLYNRLLYPQQILQNQNYKLFKTQHYAMQIALHLTLTFNIYMTNQSTQKSHSCTHTSNKTCNTYTPLQSLHTQVPKDKQINTSNSTFSQHIRSTNNFHCDAPNKQIYHHSFTIYRFTNS